MKARSKNEELIKVAYRLPKNICERLEEAAIEHRRSINDEVINTLKEYFAWQDEWAENRKKMEEMTPERLQGIKEYLAKFDRIEKYFKLHPEEAPLSLPL